jgi:maltose-binding protein MalE
MADWLNWLKESRNSFGIQLSYNSEALREQFTQRKTAYYVGDAGELSRLRQVLGDSLQVTLLPSGPGGQAQPLVTVEGLALRADAAEAGQGVTLSFMRFATDLPSQKALMDEANILPTNGSVSTTDDPFLNVFVKQAQTGYLLPSLPQSLTLLQLGPGAYMDVLDEGREAAEVVGDLTNAINKANGIVVTPTPVPTATSAPTTSAPTPESTPTAGSESSTGRDVEAQ